MEECKRFWGHLAPNMALKELLSFNYFSNSNSDTKLSEMAADIALQNFEYRYATLLIFNSTLYYGVQFFLRIFSYNILINRGTVNSEVVKISRQYVIFGSDVTVLEQIIETLRDIEIKSNGKYIIVCQSSNPKDCDQKEIIMLFWEYRIIDVVIIKCKDEQAVGYTYFPISNGKCDNLEPVKLTLSNYSDHLTTSQGEVFGMKLQNLHFCPLVVSTFIQSPYMNITNGKATGIDAELLPAIAYAFNTSIKLMLPHRGHGWGFREKNGTWMGSLADISEDFANISMTSAALTLTRISDYHISHSYNYHRIVWISHPAALQNEALKLLHPFEYSTRIALICSYLLVLLCGFVVRTEKFSAIWRRAEEDQPLKSVVFYSWMICMGQGLIRLPTKSALLHITFLWINYCFIVRTLYQVYLISSLKGKFYTDPINTIEDAIQANYSFGSGAAVRDFYIEYPEIYNKWVNVSAPDILPTLLSISKGQKFLLGMTKDTAILAIKKYNIYAHMLPQEVIVTPTVIFLKKFSPFIDPLNLIIGRLVASGLPEMLHQKYTRLNPSDKNNENEQDTLKLVDCTACYIVLLVGWVLSAVLFLLELYFGKIKKHPVILCC